MKMKVVHTADDDTSLFVSYTDDEAPAIKTIHAAVIQQIETIPLMVENTRKTVKEWLDDVFDLSEDGAGMFIKF
jgi:hypothetical protein